MVSAKLRHYYDTHEKRITWGGEYIAPREAFGAWIEIKMVQDEADPVIYHETWDFNRKLPNKVREEIMHTLRGILNILCEEEYKHSTPYIIQIDDTGRCHLISACVDGVQKTMDEVFPHGKCEWVKVR